METLTADAIVARIALAQRETPSGVVAFDGDGTLWSGDVGEDFFEAVVEKDRFLPASVDAMRLVARGSGLSEAGDGGALARRLFDGYLAHRVAEDLICEVIAWLCAGWTEEEVASVCREVVHDLDARRHTALRAVVDWARASGVPAFLVSASPRPVVEAAGEAWGFDREHVLATTAPFKDGVMCAEVVRPIPYGPGKLDQLRARTGGLPLLAAFGDNVFDVPMLESARVAALVEPKERLLARLREMPGFQPVLLRTTGA